MKKILILPLLFVINLSFSQEFSRIIEMNNNRMYGTDIIKLQTQLEKYGFFEISEIDGYYGPLTESIIKIIQPFLGFEQNGKVDNELWDFLFDESNYEILENINIVLKYNINEFIIIRENRMGYSTEGGYVEKYMKDDEIKIIKLHLFGETFQVEIYIYYIMNLNYYFILEKYHRYPFPIYYLLNDEYNIKELTEGKIIECHTYIKNNNILMEINNGNIFNTEYNLNNIINIIENN
jgi:hypothetical protein